MHGSTRRFLAAAVIAGAVPLVSPLFAGASFDPGFNPHASFREASSCPKCHPVVGGKPDADRLAPGSDNFCLGCHAKESLGRTHPVGTRPRDKHEWMKVPADFWLDDAGRMTCLTCHSAHGPFLGTVKAYPAQGPENPEASPGTPLSYRTLFLRRSGPVEGFAVLCDGCHGKP